MPLSHKRRQKGWGVVTKFILKLTNNAESDWSRGLAISPDRVARGVSYCWLLLTIAAAATTAESATRSSMNCGWKNMVSADVLFLLRDLWNIFRWLVLFSVTCHRFFLTVSNKWYFWFGVIDWEQCKWKWNLVGLIIGDA